MDNWKPSESDLAWCRRLIDMLNDGAMWGTSAGVYKIDKISKTITLMAATGIPDTWEAIHLRNKVAFGAIGWTVLEADGVEPPRFDAIIADLTRMED